MLHEYKGTRPKLGERVYVAEGAQIIGDVEIGDHSSVWYNCVIRGDVDIVRIGHHTNIQDGSIGHVMKNECPLVLRDYVTIGHGVMLHGCTVESHCLIGMRATLLNNVVVGEYSIVGAGALLTQGTKIPSRSLVLGMPARVKRTLTDAEIEGIDEYARRYFDYKETYLAMKAKQPHAEEPDENADKPGAKSLVIIGDEEVKSGTVVLRNMTTKEQKNITEDEL